MADESMASVGQIADNQEITLESLTKPGGSYKLALVGGFCERHLKVKLNRRPTGSNSWVERVWGPKCSVGRCGSPRQFKLYSATLSRSAPTTPERDPYIDPPDYIEEGPLLR